LIIGAGGWLPALGADLRKPAEKKQASTEFALRGLHEALSTQGSAEVPF